MADETAPDMVARAENAAKRLEEANKKMEENLKKQEELLSRQILGGKTDNAPAQKAPEESPKDYAKRALNGQI